MHKEFRAIKPDPRILIFQIILLAFVVGKLNTFTALWILFFVVNGLFLTEGLSSFLRNLGVFTVFFLLFHGFTALRIPILSYFFPLFFLLLIRLYPVYLSGKFLIQRTPMNELFGALEAMHLPKMLLIPLSVIYRYIPTIFEELRCIRESVSMRGLNHSTLNTLKHPVESMENLLVPLLGRSEKIAEELSAASICKGLSVIRRRSSMVPVKLNLWDLFYLISMVLLILLILWINQSGPVF